MTVQYYTTKYAKLAQDTADSFGGFFEGAVKGRNDSYDAYRHVLLGAKLAEAYGDDDARKLGDSYEGYSANEPGEHNMDRWNNDVGINNYQQWKNAVGTGQTTDSLEKWLYDAVKQGKTINDLTDTRQFVGTEIQSTDFWQFTGLFLEVTLKQVFGAMLDFVITPAYGDDYGNLTQIFNLEQQIAQSFDQGLLGQSAYNGFTQGFSDWLVSNQALPYVPGFDPNYNFGLTFDAIGAFYDSKTPVLDNALSIATKTPVILNSANGSLTPTNLGSLDANHDGKLSGTELNTLRVWADANENGMADAGEITVLSSLGISVIRSADYGFYTRGNSQLANAVALSPGKISDISVSAPDLPAILALPAKVAGNVNGSNEADTLYGGDGNDTMDGGNGNDTLLGFKGDDILFGGLGLDELQGGYGNDKLAGETDNDKLFGQTGDDTLWGGDGNDMLMGFTGTNEVKQSLDAGESDNDTLYGELGADGLFGGLGNDFLDGGDNNDYLNGGIGNDALFAGAGDDQAKGGDGNDYVGGGTGNDLLFGEAGDDGMAGDTGNDELQGGDGNDYMIGESGDDLLFGQVGNDALYGGDGNDVLMGFTGTNEVKQSLSTGESDNDALFGGKGLDNLYGGLGSDTLDGGDDNDLLSGLEGDDTLFGGSGRDEVQGGEGNDSLVGESDDDRLFGQVGNDILWGGDGNDLLVGFTGSNETKQSLSLGESDNDVLYGGAGNDLMVSGLGDDTVYGESGTDELQAGTGNDLLYAGDGDDRLFGQVGNDVLYGGDGNDVLLGFTASNESKQTLDIGESDNDWLYGGAGNDYLLGSLGNDYLDGGAGADEMEGGDGDDTYIVNSVNDSILENVDAGYDSVISSANYLLNQGIEELRLLEGLDIHGTGNALNNKITGNNRNNILDGVTGLDTLIGAGGDDIYYVDNQGDQVIELSGEGMDRVQSSISYTLGSDVEELNLLDFSKPEHGLVDGVSTLVHGYPKMHELDYIQGDAVPDYQGTCALTSIANLLTQANRPTSEADVIQVAITNNWAVTNPAKPAYDRGASTYQQQQALLDSYGIRNDLLAGYNEQGVANLIMSGRGVMIAVNAGKLWEDPDPNYVGSGSVNHVVTVTGAVYNESDGTLMGFYITDSGRHKVSDMTRYISLEKFRESANVSSAYAVYTVEPLKLWAENINGTGNNLNNSLIGNRGDNTLTGLDGNDTLVGGSGADTLSGGSGADSMSGGEDDDAYLVDNILDVVSENPDEGTDEVVASVTYTLPYNVENLTLTGTAVIDGTGNALDNILTGNSANNMLTGYAGNDILIGYMGNDILNGYAGSDTLNGYAGNDTLNGGADIDVMIGGIGDDTYIVDDIADIVTEQAAQGIDTISSRITYGLADTDGAGSNGGNVENLTLTGTTAINGTGNALNNVLTGNAAANSLNGDLGNDTLNGGLGNDVLTGGAGQDSFQLTTAGNVDRITDFSVVDDMIQLENAIFTQLTATGTLAAGMFRSGAGITTAADANDYLIYNSTDGKLYYDQDANGAGAAVQIALIGNLAALTAADFVVI